MDTLHIYGQERQHDTVTIQGTVEALIMLRNALNLAIDTDEYGECTTFTNDGEGYDVCIVVRKQKEMEEAELPYYGVL